VKHLYKKRHDKGLVYHLCNPRELIEMDHDTCVKRFQISDCIDCAKVAYKKFLAKGNKTKLEEVAIRFRLKPSDVFLYNRNV
jgi:hypothetical protein